MHNRLMPRVAHVKLEEGTLTAAAQTITRRLSDMAEHFQDQEAARAMLEENPVLYHVYMAWAPEEGYQWLSATTVIEPGRVGDEYFMTKGHFHAAEDAPEVYLTLRGEGMLVMQTHDGLPEVLPQKAGMIHYIPGGWAHRVVNTGDEALVLFAVWPVAAGHDYAWVTERGFPRLVVARGGRAAIVENPHFEQAR
jgi:glucose-6-phosphate isomerase